MNVRASCIYVNMRDLKLYDDMYCLKKKEEKKKRTRAGLICSFPWSYTACIRSFLKCILSFSLFTIQNASPMIASKNSRVHGVIANDK